MAEQHFVKGYEGFIAFIKDFKPAGKIVNVLFTGEKDPSGNSWCPDCVEAVPYIQEALDKYGEGTALVTVDVGDRYESVKDDKLPSYSFLYYLLRPTWKDMNNSFRKDKDSHLQVIPTLVRWKHPQRLEGDQLLKPELLQMFFADED